MKYLFLCLIFLSLFSCQKYLEFEGDNAPSKLVVNCIFTDDDLLNVHLSNSLSQLDEAPLLGITNGELDLVDSDGNSLGNFINIGNGYYESDFLLSEINTEFTLKASAPNFDAVEAASEIPNNSLEINSATISTVSSSGFFDVLNLVTIQFQESFVADQYYRLSFQMMYYNEDIDDYDFYDIYPMMEQGLIEDEGANGDHLLFNDGVINGLTDEFSFSAYPDFFDFENEEVILPEKMVVNVKSFPYETYQYMRSYNLYIETEWDVFATPVQVFTNVENGLGIFGGYNEKEFIIEFN